MVHWFLASCGLQEPKGLFRGFVVGRIVRGRGNLSCEQVVILCHWVQLPEMCALYIGMGETTGFQLAVMGIQWGNQVPSALKSG